MYNSSHKPLTMPLISHSKQQLFSSCIYRYCGFLVVACLSTCTNKWQTEAWKKGVWKQGKERRERREREEKEEGDKEGRRPGDRERGREKRKRKVERRKGRREREEGREGGRQGGDTHTYLKVVVIQEQSGEVCEGPQLRTQVSDWSAYL